MQYHIPQTQTNIRFYSYVVVFAKGQGFQVLENFLAKIFGKTSPKSSPTHFLLYNPIYHDYQS